MTTDFVIGFGRQAIELCLMMALPMLAVGLGVGVVVSIIQAATQIQEICNEVGVLGGEVAVGLKQLAD